MEVPYEELFDRQEPMGVCNREEKELELPTQNASEEELKAWKAWNKKDKKVMFLIS